MPIVKREDFGTERAPAWCRIAGGVCAMGFTSREPGGKAVEPHFHDAEEFWFVIKGKARVVTEGQEYVVGPGDVVCTHMGDEHAIPEIVEAPYQQVWIECNRRGAGRKGHLHRGVDAPAARD
ncbi:MAG: cupin domain-containing protein [Candidatus Sumerlaeota bacterium]|nr:cupin domain-containing protein [Candidatus Sumerlaeota bacterium]